MNQIKWEPAQITPHSAPRKKPYARVSKSSVTFNGAAASLVDNIAQYKWAKVQVGTVNGEPSMVGFQFVREEAKGALPVRKQSKNHKGVTFFSRELIQKYFGVSGVGLLYMQLDVVKVNETTLGVKLLTQEALKEKSGLNELEGQLEELDKKLDNLL